MEAKRLGELLKHTDAGRFGVHDPVEQKCLGRLLVVLFPDLVEFVLEVIGDGQRLIQPEGFVKPLGLAARASRFSGRFNSSQRTPLSTFFCIVSAS